MRTLTAALAIAATLPALAGSAILEWVPPTENTDGTPLTDLAGFRVQWGCAGPGNYTAEAVVLYPTLRSYLISNLPDSGTCYFTVRALNAGRGELATVPARTSAESDPAMEASLVMTANPAPRVPYTRAVDARPAVPMTTLDTGGRLRRGFVGDPIEFVVDATSSPTRHELRARFAQSGETFTTPFTADRVTWVPPFAGLWWVSLRSCNAQGCGPWRSSAEDGFAFWFTLKAPTGGGIE